jgi:hypothetical protein
VRSGRFLATILIVYILLVAVYLVLLFTVFKAPSYVPFASGNLSTLVPEGSCSGSSDGAWQRHRFDGKGDLTISIKDVGTSGLGELIQHNRRGEPDEDGVDLRKLVRRARGDSADAEVLDPSGSSDSPMRIEAGRTYIQLLASNTPNVRFMEEVPAFDSTIFCLGSVGRGDRRYRYLVHSGDIVVDLHMHSSNSSHIVYKEVLDKALLNLRIDGQSSNHILEQALNGLSDRSSPRWSQGNVFWLIFMIALPTGIMLIFLPILMMRARRHTASGSNPP